jgi:hypothetical protein
VVGGLVLGAVGLLTAMVVARSGTREITIPSGTRIVAKLDEAVSTRKNEVGDRIELTSSEPIEIDDGVEIPEGVHLIGEVTHVEGGGRLGGAPELTLRFREIGLEGRSYDIVAEPFRVRGKSATGETAAEIGGGAVVGGVVGAIAGSAVKGAIIGAVLGTGVAVATEGGQIVLPAGTRLRVSLSEPVTVRVKPEKPKPDLRGEE